MKDLTITAISTWTTPLLLNKGDKISISVKGTFLGTIKVQRWLAIYTATPSAANIGTIQEYTAPIEAIDDSAGLYYYRIGTDSTPAFSGTAYVHVT